MVNLKASLTKLSVLGGPLGLYRAHQFGRAHAILVHTASKVGSTTVYQNLIDLYGWEHLFHTHFLNPRTIVNFRIRKFHPIHLRVIDGQNKPYYKMLFAAGADKRIKVITLVRDPLARFLSAKFQNFEVTGGKEPLPSVVALEEKVAQAFWVNYFDNWFDQELRAVFDLDVFAHKIDPSRGFHIFKNEKIDLLLLKLEDLDTCWEQAWLEFTGLKPFKLTKRNVGDQKTQLPDTYREYRSKFKLKEEDLNKHLQTRVMQSFYTEAERQQIFERWVRK
jgi:hypothetical protein